MDYTLNKYSNYKTAISFQSPFVETNIFSISTITSIDKKTRVSSNGLLGLFSWALMSVMKEEHLRYSMIPLMPEILGNAKIYLPVHPKHFWVGGGLNTDYYLFYKNSIIFTEALTGVRIQAVKLRLYLDYRYPVNGSYLTDKKPYLSLGLGLL